MAKEMRWISVNDSLPERELEVLGINRFNEFKVCQRSKPWISEPEDWCVGLIEKFYPTHWMPLPEAPNG